MQGGATLGMAMLSIVSGVKWVVRIACGGPKNWMDKTLPLVSMFGIWFILIIITAQTRDKLLTVGGTLVLAAIIHNAVGYLGGYWGCKTFGKILGRTGFLLGLRKTGDSLVSESDCRTVAFEVGMQNGGMATGLAMEVLKSPTAALPPNVFGTWMNVSGSLLANWWKRTTKEKGTFYFLCNHFKNRQQYPPNKK